MVAFCLVILIPINYEAVVQLKSGGLAVFHFADEKLLIAAKKKGVGMSKEVSADDVARSMTLFSILPQPCPPEIKCKYY
jgi:hypothetical protein